MNTFEEELAKAEAALQKNRSGHLPLPYRVTLMLMLQDQHSVNKVFLECTKQVYRKWQQQFPTDESVYQLIEKSENYLYYNQSCDFRKAADQYKNYFDTIVYQDASCSAHSALSLCYSLAYHASGILNIEAYQNEDDDSFDWETWNPDFWAAMAYAGGNPFMEEGSIEKRKEFWKWYLLTVAAMFNRTFNPSEKWSSAQPAFSQVPGVVRSQLAAIPAIILKLEQVVAYTTKDMVKQYGNREWSQLQIEGYCMSAGTSVLASFIEKKETEKKPIKLSYFLYRGEQSSAYLLSQVKQLMYAQAPAEGAWFKCSIVVNELSRMEVQFDYDNREAIPESKQNPDYLQLEFANFPRSKYFTPAWWQCLIDNKLPYHE